MKTDRELMELSARAARMILRWMHGLAYDEQGKEWTPLTDDGDALRLAASTELAIDWSIPGRVQVAGPCGICLEESICESIMKSTRRAIVRASAEIGEAMNALELIALRGGE